MKKIDLAKLQPSPVLAARAGAGKPTTTFEGYIRSADQDGVALSADQSGDRFLEIPRSSIVGVFSSDDDPDQVTVIVHSDAEVRHVTTSDATAAWTTYLGISPGFGDQCPAGCQSGDKSQTCCCGVGQKCVSDEHSCRCEDTGQAGGVYTPPGFPRFPEPGTFTSGGRWVYVPA